MLESLVLVQFEGYLNDYDLVPALGVVAIAYPGNFKVDFDFVHVSAIVAVVCFVQCQHGVVPVVEGLEVLIHGHQHVSNHRPLSRFRL